MRGWQFWIDVGGTFTDCLARSPDGDLRALKVLSSGAVKAQIRERLGPASFVVERLPSIGADFFRGYRLSPADSQDGRRAVGVVRSRGERLDLDADLEGLEPGSGIELSSGETAPILAMREVLGRRLDQEIGPLELRLGTTLATNALLERKGARTGFVVTRGFGDILLIGNQDRPDLFELDIRKPAPLASRVCEIDERVAADGSVLRAPDPAVVEQRLRELRGEGVDSIGVCFLNAYRNGEHEELVAQLAHEVGFGHVSVSSRLSPTPKIVARGDTTVVDAYLTPVIRAFVESVGESAPQAELRLMTSAGGLLRKESYSGRDAILSGPAGGVVALSEAASRAGVVDAIGFDMGGTSTDVSRFSGELEFEHETEKAGVRIVAPMLAVETVAAGGGSICRFDGQRLQVGPESAGADPGPTSYGHGGPLAVTDMNLVLGRLEGALFPFSLDRSRVEERLRAVASEVEAATGDRLSTEEVANGFVRIANAKMAAAIRRISIARGYDLRRYLLVSFGGAGGQHACAIADELAMSKVLVHPFSGVMSAYGMGLADIRRFGVRTVLEPLTTGSRERLESLFADVESDLRARLLEEPVEEAWLDPPRRLLDLRYVGQSSTLVVSGEERDWRERFEIEHRRLYGHLLHARDVEIVTIRVEQVARMPKPEVEHREERPHRAAVLQTVPVHVDGSWCEAELHRRSDLEPGARLTGPAVVVEETATTFVDPGWGARILATRDLLLERPASGERTGRGSAADTERAATRVRRVEARSSPVELELWNQRFAAVAEEMGSILQRTSLSVNVKERLDFSCAVFTSDGRLVANAPHMPVHLGAMSETVRCLLEDVDEIDPGDVLLTNDPFRGGSHLPDITVVTPVFDPPTTPGIPAFFVASRAHHADVGGMRPGSMPPDSRNLGEEGVLLPAFKVVVGGRERFDALRNSLTGGRYPARDPDQNVADVGAQIAANQAGVASLVALLAEHGRESTLDYMDRIQAAAEAKVRARLRAMPDESHHFEDRLDDGSKIRLCLRVVGDEARLDFDGTSPQLETNLNANRAIVKAAAIYCFRCLLDEDIPLNEGVLAPLEIHLPPCLLNPAPGPDADSSPAVVGGNVETSQRVTDVILGALRLAAASQGTMNNLTFGNESFGYYETICGGAGAGPDFDGADAVHTHMTNTRLTDPEVLEAQFPVRLRRFEIRRGSGGRGRRSGGDGVHREIEFLEPLEVAILSQRRSTAPFGLGGAEAGKPGRNRLLRRDGSEEDLGPVGSARVERGDRLVVATPGGGGYGARSGRRSVCDSGHS